MLLLLVLFLPYSSGQGCGAPRCSFRYFQQPQAVYGSQYVQPVAVPRPGPQPHPVEVDPQLYYTNSDSYALPPQVLASTDKEMTVTTVTPDPVKEYQKFEKELSKLSPYAPTTEPTETTPPAVESPFNVTGVTYIRELSYIPQTYLPRPMPYRPHPLLPRGCPVLPPQYVRPIPYMPRGYVTPYIPQPQPVPAPVPQPAPIPQPQPVPVPVPPQPVVYPQTAYVRPPPLNDCCGRCHSPCQYRPFPRVRSWCFQEVFQAKASKTIEKERNYVPMRDSTEVTKDTRCSNEELKELMLKATTRTPALSKRIIQKVAEEEIGGYFSVFCSREDFSYVARSEMFCQTEKNDIICYAFQHT